MKKLIKAALILAAVVMFYAVPAGNALAAGETAVYSAPDGFKVVSYSGKWADQNKLKEVYIELLRNTHGEELKLLNRINIYPGPDPEGISAAGRWYGVWSMKEGKPVLKGGRYINIYDGDEFTTVKSIARTLAHEYGHHFTYYYFYKTEKKLWDNWKSTGLAKARKLSTDPRVASGNVSHKWLIQEIAAEDYVQFFGSPTAKESRDFRDIRERLSDGRTSVSYSTDIYNYQPQENYEIPLASNIPGLREYWLKAAGLSYKLGNGPSKVQLELSKVNRLEGVNTPQYVFTWGKSSDDRTQNLEYTLVYFQQLGQQTRLSPVKTVTDGEPLEAIIGSADNSRMYIWEEVPGGTAFFILYIKDGDNHISASDILAVDFGTDSYNPDTVVIDGDAFANGVWFPVRVKIGEEQMAFDVPPVIQNNRTMVPFRAIFEELGAQVSWEAGERKITATKGETELVLRVGELTAEINGEPVNLDSAPVIKSGRTLVPIWFICESLGVDYEWNHNLKLVTISPPGKFHVM